MSSPSFHEDPKKGTLILESRIWNVSVSKCSFFKWQYGLIKLDEMLFLL